MRGRLSLTDDLLQLSLQLLHLQQNVVGRHLAQHSGTESALGYNLWPGCHWFAEPELAAIAAPSSPLGASPVCDEMDRNKSINDECVLSMSWLKIAVLHSAQLCTQRIQFCHRIGLVPLLVSPSRRHVWQRKLPKSLLVTEVVKIAEKLTLCVMLSATYMIWQHGPYASNLGQGQSR